MEHTNKAPDANEMIKQMQMIKFGGVFNAALDVLKKEPVMLVALFLAPMVVTGLLDAYVWPLITTPLAVQPIVVVLLSIVFAVVDALIGFFGFGMLVRAVSKVFAGQKVDAMATFNFVKAHFVNAVKLAINMFVFTGAWLILAYFAAVVILLPIVPAVSGLLGMLSPIALIVYIVVFFKKIMQASMGYAVYWSAETPAADAALKRSIELGTGIEMTLFGNYFLMGLIGGVVTMVLSGILVAILGVLGKGAVAIAAAAAAGVVGAFYASFQYSLKGQVEKFRGGHHA